MSTEEILQRCLEDVLAGRRTPAECAAAYPAEPGLEQELRAALTLRQAQALSLSPAASQRIEAQLRERLAAGGPAVHMPAAPARARLTSRLDNRLRWLVAPALVATLLAGVGTAAAANQSLPGDLLYPVKRMDEGAQLFVSPPAQRGFVYAGLAQRRLDEVSAVTARKTASAGELSGLFDDVTAETAQALALVDSTPPDRQASLLSTLVQVTAQEQTVLTGLQASATAQAQPGLDRAVAASNQGHAAALARLGQVLAAQGGTETPTATLTATTTATADDTATPTLTATATLPTPTASEPPEATATGTHVPPGQTQEPPGQTKEPPGQTKVPPGQTHVPQGQTDVPPGQTNVPPGQTKTPPGKQKTPGK